MTTPDRRLNAYRADLAERGLEGQVEAARFVDGTPARIVAPLIGLRPKPDLTSGIDTELLFGEAVTVFDRADGWCWVKALSDDYVGYLPESALGDNGDEPTHVVTVQRTFLYREPELRKPYKSILSMGSRIRVVGAAEARGNHYAMLADGTAIFAKHLQPLAACVENSQEAGKGDYVDIAARFLETPYLWGGRSGLGIDCSGLVQLSMLMTGHKAPRDTDMQAAGLGKPIDRGELRRGDLVFWKGHVAIMEDAETIIHATGHTMTVVRENFEEAVKRIGWLYEQPNGYRRPLN